MCSTHSREAFRDTVKFLGLTLFVDFPNDSADCHKTDPQIAHSTKAEAGTGILRWIGSRHFLLRRRLVSETASYSGQRGDTGSLRILATAVAADPVAHYLAAAMYLFHASRGRLPGSDPDAHYHPLRPCANSRRKFNKLFSASSAL